MNGSPSSNLSGKGAPRLADHGTVSVSRPIPEQKAAAKRHGEKGGGHLKAIVWTMILVAFIYVAAMVLPILINEYQFQDSLQNIARFASVNRKSGEQIRKDVMDEAQKADLPVQAEDVKVESNSGNIKINVDYSVTVDLKVYQWTLNFHPAASNASLI
jgi:cell division protein FtsL